MTVPVTAATGAGTSVTLNSRTVRRIGMIHVPGSLTVNQWNMISGSAVAAAGTAKLCLYTEDGQTKVIDVTTASINATGTNFSTTVAGVVVGPGSYYVVTGAVGLGTSISWFFYTTPGTEFYNAGIVSGKAPFEGTITMAQDVCDTTFTPTNITAAVTSTPIGQLAN